jgi:hypothetical protein
MVRIALDNIQMFLPPLLGSAYLFESGSARSKGSDCPDDIHYQNIII